MADQKKKALGRGLGVLVDSSHAREKTGRGPAEGVQNLSPEIIVPNPRQPRQHFDETALTALAASIKRDGIIQPLAVRRDPEQAGRYELIAGERRLRAAKLAGLPLVPCLVLDTDEIGLSLLSLVENLLREDLNVLDEAEAYQRLVEEFDLTQEEIAARVGRSRPHVTNTLRLLSLPELVRAYLTAGELTAGHGRALLALDRPEEQLALAREIRERGLSVRETENLVRRAAAFLARKAKAARRPEKTHPYAHLADDLRNRLGTKVQLAGGQKRGRIEIHYFSEEELTRLIDLLLHGN